MSEKKGFKLKNLFVNEDESDTAVAEATGNKKPAAAKAATLSAPSSISSLSGSGSVFAPVSAAEKNEFAEFLNSVYEKGNFPGPDYQEYTDALKSMEAMPMDEKTKFNAIYAGFKVQNVTKAKLVDTGNKYVALIDEQVSGFNQEIDGILASDVTDKQKKVTKINDENAEIENQMRLLTEKKNKNNELSQQLSSEVAEQVSSLNIKKASFELAANEFKAKIVSNLDKIRLYLPD